MVLVLLVALLELISTTPKGVRDFMNFPFLLRSLPMQGFRRTGGGGGGGRCCWCVIEKTALLHPDCEKRC